MQIEFCYSGFQTGADISGIKAAKHCGISTGGWMPKGWITQDGPKPEYAELYGAKEHRMSGYPGRTEQNVMDTDGTIRIASDFKSTGEKLTLSNIKWHNKPHIDVDIKNPRPIEEVALWIKENNIKILNVAGNSEKTSPGIEKIAFDYLVKLFEDLK